MIVIGLCFTKSRHAIMQSARTPWIIFAIAAIASMCFSAMSGIVGRSGWFAQIFAIIAIFHWITTHEYKINRTIGGIISTILVAAILFHYIETARWQMKVGKEVEDAAQLYSESKDGQVYFDATRDNELPWWTLNKTRGVPDADDLYLLAAFSQYYGNDNAPLKLLPTEVLDINAELLKTNGIVALKNGDKISTSPISEAKTLTSEREGISISIYNDANGKEWVVTPFIINDTLYHITPRITDPGDRLTTSEK